MAKITVIGAGNVGATIANDLMIQGLASDILLIDINGKKAEGEAMDIYQGAPFCSPAYIHAGSYADAENSDIVIITSGMARKPGQSRLELAQMNVNILKSIAPEITAVCPEAIYIIVANPVDILTYAFHKITNIPESCIIGSGTILDTSRLQTILSHEFNISAKNIHAHVYGEHGDSSFVPWSLVHIANNKIDEYMKNAPHPERITWTDDKAGIEEYVKKSGGTIIANKGATFFAVSMSVCHIVKCCLLEANTAVTVSTMMHGEYGIDDVCLSVLTLVNRDGVLGKITNDLQPDEIAKLRSSADKLKEVLAGLDI